MGILVTEPVWMTWIIGGVTLFALAKALVWLVDRIANRLGYDLPDTMLETYARWLGGLLAVLIIFATTAGVQVDLDLYISIFVAALSALGYQWAGDR